MSSLESLVSGGTQGKEVLSREKALDRTLILALSRALAAFLCTCLPSCCATPLGAVFLDVVFRFLPGVSLRSSFAHEPSQFELSSVLSLESLPEEPNFRMPSRNSSSTSLRDPVDILVAYSHWSGLKTWEQNSSAGHDWTGCALDVHEQLTVQKGTDFIIFVTREGVTTCREETAVLIFLAGSPKVSRIPRDPGWAQDVGHVFYFNHCSTRNMWFPHKKKERQVHLYIEFLSFFLEPFVIITEKLHWQLHALPTNQFCTSTVF